MAYLELPYLLGTARPLLPLPSTGHSWLLLENILLLLNRDAGLRSSLLPAVEGQMRFTSNEAGLPLIQSTLLDVEVGLSVVEQGLLEDGPLLHLHWLYSLCAVAAD